MSRGKHWALGEATWTHSWAGGTVTAATQRDAARKQQEGLRGSGLTRIPLARDPPASEQADCWQGTLNINQSASSKQLRVWSTLCK